MTCFLVGLAAIAGYCLGRATSPREVVLVERAGQRSEPSGVMPDPCPLTPELFELREKRLKKGGRST